MGSGHWLSMSGHCRILSEDKVMVEQLRPDLLEREVNVKADGVQTAFRKVPPPSLNLPSGSCSPASYYQLVAGWKVCMVKTEFIE